MVNCKVLFPPKRVRKRRGAQKSIGNWEMIFGQGMRTAAFQFSESCGSLNGLDLFTECLSCRNPNPSFTESRPFFQKRSGDPNPQYFSKSTAVQMGDVLPYKWEAYCSTNGRRIAGFPFLRRLEARKARRYKWGGVLPYKLEVYCRTF